MFAFLVECWGRWRWPKSCGSAALLPQECTPLQFTGIALLSWHGPLESQVLAFPVDLPRLVHAGQAGAVSCWILHGLRRQVSRLWQWAAACTLGKRLVVVRQCSQLSFSVCFLSLMSVLMFPDAFTFLFLVCTQGKVSLTHTPASP